MNMFNLISTCVSAQDAWDKLHTHCEGSASVKKTRMRFLTSKFEKLRMDENETIMQYNARLKSLANEAYVLGDPISNERLVSKVLHSIYKRFNNKVCVVDESKDTSIMRLDELISSLRTYEMEMEKQDDYKGKSIAFQVSNDSYSDFSEMKHEVCESDLGDDSTVLITKKFGDYFKVMREKKKSEKGGQPSKFSSLTTSECYGYEHYAYECANRLRKYMNVSLSDEDYEEEQEKGEQVNPLGVGSDVSTPGHNTGQKSVCFVASNSDNEEHIAEDFTRKGVQNFYEEFYTDWIKRNKLNTALTKENVELKADVAKLKVFISKKDLELGLLKSGIVTYGGGAKEKIVGKGTLNVEGFLKLHNVLHVKGLNENLISISQLCDDDLHVKFDKNTCKVFDDANICVMIGSRSADNCYQLGDELACRHSKMILVYGTKSLIM
ncbi:uncharacterized protein [Henckelia pumila]|uniref:uncharacterized protein n=1 Tax=Henckelia pumila TaxID=405737 RepID=UPI003C6E88C2